MEVFYRESAFENVDCKIAAILFWPQSGKLTGETLFYSHLEARDYFIITMSFYQYRNPILRSCGSLISTMGFPLLVRWHLESGLAQSRSCEMECWHYHINSFWNLCFNSMDVAMPVKFQNERTTWNLCQLLDLARFGSEMSYCLVTKAHDSLIYNGGIWNTVR